MVMKAIFSGSQQIFEEVCEHCGEKIRDLHISDFATKKDSDPRTIIIRDASNDRITLKNKQEKISEVTASFIRKGLLVDVEARSGFTNKKLIYGMRAEAMCSESIDLVAGVTQSFCYRVLETPADTRFQKTGKDTGISLSASLARAEPTDITGSRMGIDRKGNVIKMQRYKNIDLDTGQIKTDGRGTEIEHNLGPQSTSWFRSLNPSTQQQLITAAKACTAFKRQHGSAVDDMTVVGSYKTEAQFRAAILVLGCRI